MRFSCTTAGGTMTHIRRENTRRYVSILGRTFTLTRLYSSIFATRSHPSQYRHGNSSAQTCLRPRRGYKVRFRQRMNICQNRVENEWRHSTKPRSRFQLAMFPHDNQRIIRFRNTPVNLHRLTAKPINEFDNTTYKMYLISLTECDELSIQPLPRIA